MKLGTFGILALLSVSVLLCVVLVLPLVKANPDPLNTAWYITNGSGQPVDGAHLTIYWSTSPNGPFTIVPSSIVEDKIAGVFQNPVITGTWNPTHSHGMAVVDLHITAISNYYFYVKIEFDSTTEYWPTATSIKPGDATWSPVESTGSDASPSGWAAAGSGMGNGPTTGFPNNVPPPPVIPEIPIGTLIATASMGIGLVAYVGVRRRKAIGFP